MKKTFSLKIVALDGISKTMIPAWGVLAESGKVEQRKAFPGEIEFSLPEGKYSITVHSGLAYQYSKTELKLDRDTTVKISLQPWFDFKGLGIFTGDAHNHINYPTAPAELVTSMQASGIDMISLCQGWLTPPGAWLAGDGEKLHQYLSSLSTADAHIYMGAEFPKTRFGHVCWWQFPVISDPQGCYDSYHDTEYFAEAGISGKKIANPALELPYHGESPLNKIIRWKKQGGVSTAPHPTSWWMDNERASLICTNIAADFCFVLLAGKIYDSLTVMGYDAEHIFYQNFWFHLLNEGYRIPGVAETDGDLNGRHQVGDFRTYVYCGTESFKLKPFLKNLAAGQSFMTSGPILITLLDGQYRPGTVVKNDGQPHKLAVSVLSHPAPEEYISWLVLYKNGRPTEIIDIEDKKLRSYNHEFIIKPDPGCRTWFLVKVFGRKRPRKKSFADVMAYAELCEKEKNTEYIAIKQAAFTNPYYFEPELFRPPKLLKPDFSGKITDAATHRPLAGVKIEIFNEGNVIKSGITGGDGNFSFSGIPLSAELQISCDGYDRQFRSIYLDYPPLRNYFESVYSGKWALSNKLLQPGQVPWSVFRFDELRQMLSSIHWDFELKKTV